MGILGSLVIFRRYVRRNILWLWIPLVPILWGVGGGLVLPSATLHHSKDAAHEVRLIWNVQHRIYKVSLLPGKSSTEHGFLFPKDGFFMQIDWWASGRQVCVMVTPGWIGTDIYLDNKGYLDVSLGNRNDWNRLVLCPGAAYR